MASRKQFWDRVAYIYTYFMKRNDTAYRESVKMMKPFLNKNMDVLEIGCGTGQISFLLNRYVRMLIASDYSEKMIEKARKRSKCNNIEFRVEDGTKLSFKDESFNALVIANVLHIVPDSDSILREARRVLKNDGFLFIINFINDKEETTFLEKLMKRLGFKTYRKFTEKKFIKYIEGLGFKMIKTKLIKASPLNELILIAKKV